MRDDALTELLSRRGAVTLIADTLGITTAAVSQWRRVPLKHVDAVAAATGVPAQQIRPDLAASPQPQPRRA